MGGAGRVRYQLRHSLPQRFFVCGPLCPGLCSILLATLQHIVERFEIPLASDKTVGPVAEISFLGIVIDFQAMECRLPDDKLGALHSEICLVIGKCKIQLRQLQSLLGKLNFACPWGGFFVALCRLLWRASLFPLILLH